MTRKFFYVCAGMLMLALSYHFGASTAGAQGPPGSFIECAASDGGNAWAVIGRRLYAITGTGLDQHRAAVIPGTSPVIACGTDRAVLESGQVYAWDGNASWLLLGTFPGGAPTPAQNESWGQVKARYRSTPSAPVTPGGDNR